MSTQDNRLAPDGLIGTGAADRNASYRYLKAAGLFWFAIVCLGQWAFLYYIIAFYGASIINGDLEIWNRFEAFGVTPYIPGDAQGNFTFGAHALAAGVIAFGGALQLIPQIRQRLPNFHRWNGRLFLTTVVVLTLSGFYLTWFRGSAPEQALHLDRSINGVLILLFSYFTLAKVLVGDIANHRRWALRLYLVSIANWTQRVGVMSYMTVGNMLGLTVNFSDAFFPLWAYGCFLLPLAVLEMYFMAQKQSSTKLQITTGTLITTLSLFMVIGIFAYSMLTRLLITGEPLPF